KRQNDRLEVVDNANRVFEIGSITKVFTTQLLLNAVIDGLVENLDAPIQQYCPFEIQGNPQITFRQLANHTSGLSSEISASIFNTDPANPYKRWDEERLKRHLEKEIEITHPAGEKYSYSNIGMAILSNTICHLRSANYEAILQKEVFQPLEMINTTTKRGQVQDILVKGYNWKGEATANWDLAALEGTGAILSTSDDLATYIQWNFEALKSQLAPMAQPSYVINEELEVALGWHIVKENSRTPFLWHNGGTGGYKSSMAINLANNTGVVVLTNIGATNNPKKRMIDQLCYDLMETLGE
ncbi:MAG: serine hydrolase domain-containing protein, partial [Bacteroidota bacterium]